MPIKKSTAWCHYHLIGKLATDRHARATHRADQIAPAGKFPHLQLLAKTQIPQLLATRAIQHTDRHITAHGDLIQGQGAVNFQFGGKSGRHLQGICSN
jgi:hypothetical protein